MHARPGMAKLGPHIFKRKVLSTRGSSSGVSENNAPVIVKPQDGATDKPNIYSTKTVMKLKSIRPPGTNIPKPITNSNNPT